MASKYDNLKEDIIIDYYENNLTIEEIYKKYNIKSRAYVYTFLKERRDYSERSKLAHQQHPDSFKHSEETKEKIRQKRLQYMKDHPEDTAWRKKNSPSYPEQVFIKFLKEKEYDKHYYIERECPVFPYYIDFAFVNEKVAVEIDGSQHLDEERSKKDKENKEHKSDYKKILKEESPIYSNNKQFLAKIIKDGDSKTLVKRHIAIEILLNLLKITNNI